jgi:hypothetical protein
MCPILWKYPGIRLRRTTEITDSTHSDPDAINCMNLGHISEAFHRLNHTSISNVSIGFLFSTVFSFRISKRFSDMEPTRICVYKISSLGQPTKGSPPDKQLGDG